MTAKRALLLHGFMSTADSYFLPHLKQCLAEQNYDVHLRSLPEPNAPTPEGWASAIEDWLDGTTFDLVAAHSLGGGLALQLFSQNRLKAKKFVMLGSSVGLENVTSLGLFLSPPLNNNLIKENAGEIFTVHSVDDPWSDYEHALLFVKQLNATAIITKGHGHFEVDQLPPQVMKVIL